MKIAFHSYKGGVGRTKIMVGVGAFAAMKGQRIGMLDFDLDASGLNTIFGGDAGKLGKRELMHMLVEREYLGLDRAMQTKMEILRERFKRESDCENGGKLRYLPTASDPAKSEQINLLPSQAEIRADAEKKRKNMRVFLNEFLNYAEAECGVTHLLIDLKPGYSPSFLALLRDDNIDQIVIVSRVDQQNLEGLERLVPDMVEAGKHPIVVANMLPQSTQTEAHLNRLKDMLEKKCNQKVNVYEIPMDQELFFDRDFEWAGQPDSPMYKAIDRLSDDLFSP